MKLKRSLAFLLALCLTLTLLPPQAQAAETPQATMDTGNMTIEGTNGFGNLLSAEIAETQEEETASGYQAGYCITELTFDGSTATVTYDAQEEAVLVVAVYAEDGLQMLASGKTTVSPDATQATVAIAGDMPAYFYAGAFLLDCDDYVPLCQDYSTPMYTREMQELLASTVDDYDPDLVYNLDDDRTTNFAVFAENTVVVREQAGVNTVVSADDDARVYVIENADETITSLQPGDVLAYPYGDGQILIVKVDTISTDGTTATITGSDMEMDEAFQAVKIETQTSDYALTPSCGEGITYVGSTPQTRSADTSVEDGLSSTFEIKLKKCGDDGKEVEINGSLTLGITTSVTYYITESYHMVELKFSFSQAYAVTASGKYQIKDGIPISKFTIHALVGVDVSVTPKLMLEFSGALTAEYSYIASIGAYIEYDGTEWDVGVIVEQPKKEFDFRLEGCVFFGVSLEPSVEIMDGMLATIKLEGKLGVELKGTANIIDWEEDPSAIHDCNICIDGDLSLVYSLEPSITLLNSDKLTLKAKWLDVKFKYLDFYWSKDRDEFHLGTCPYISYRVTIAAFDENYSVLADTPIRLSDGTVHTTGKHGAAVVYLPNGTYTAGILSNDITASAEFTVADDSQKVLLIPSAPEPGLGLPGDVGSEIITDYGAVVDFGTCDDKITWILTGGGNLIISGKGDMPKFNSTVDVPWRSYRSNITGVTVNSGITSVADYAFYYCTNLREVSLPEGIVTIGVSAIRDCRSLTDIRLPHSLTTIGAYAFSGCKALTEVIIPEGVTHIENNAFDSCTSLSCVSLPTSLQEIDDFAFTNCTSLTAVSLPDGVTVMGWYLFASCSNLTDVKLPAEITEIPSGIFSGCTSLEEITIPDRVTAIHSYAFSGCHSLSNIRIPDGVTILGTYAFAECRNLTNIYLPEGITVINSGTFEECTSLTSITLPDGLTSIASYAFSECGNLTEIHIPDTVTTIDIAAFHNCINLTSVVLPDTVISLGKNVFASCYALTEVTLSQNLTEIPFGAFYKCTSLERITLPEKVTEIGEYALEYCSSLTEVTISGDGVAISDYAFAWCSSLTKIVFRGDAPIYPYSSSKPFAGVTATVYYPADNPTWTADVMRNYGGTLTWVPYTQDEAGNMVINEAAAVTVTTNAEALAKEAGTALPASFTDDLIIDEQPQEEMTPDAIYGGEYATETTDTYTLKTAAFSGLVPGEEYVMLAMLSIESEDLLATDNLLGILQGTAGADGTLVFRYVQRVDAEVSYVIACGASNKNLADAEITFPEMTADGTLQVVNPTVVYDGKILTEGVDYEITGTVDFTEPGEYTCQIRGLHNYTGLVTCTYTVAGNTILPGDLNDDGEVDIFDANLAVGYYNGTVSLDADALAAADVNGDGEIDIFDANLIVSYYNGTIAFFPIEE